MEKEYICNGCWNVLLFLHLCTAFEMLMTVKQYFGPWAFPLQPSQTVQKHEENTAKRGGLTAQCIRLHLCAGWWSESGIFPQKSHGNCTSPKENTICSAGFFICFLSSYTYTTKEIIFGNTQNLERNNKLSANPLEQFSSFLSLPFFSVLEILKLQPVVVAKDSVMGV